MSIIEVSNLNYAYNNEPVLENINFTVEKGDYLGIIGPNGGGKTTLVKLILGILHANVGQIRLFDTPIGKFNNWQRLGYVPQRISQELNNFPISVAEVVASGLNQNHDWQRILRDPDSPAINRALKIAGIMDLKKRRLNELSGGQRQRVYIARALVSQPEILILDEPTVGVDVGSQDKFYRFLANLNRKGLTIVFVSHDVEVIGKQVKMVLCVNRTLVCHGTPKEFIKPEFLAKLYGRQIKYIVHHH
jgi:zinc transport system ATP-binding protein